MYSYGPPHMAVQKQDDQLELTYSNYVRTQDVTLKTCRRRWVIGRSGERGSGISVLVARHDDDDLTHRYQLLPLQARVELGEMPMKTYFAFKTGASPSNELMSYPGHSLGESYPSAEIQFQFTELIRCGILEFCVI